MSDERVINGLHVVDCPVANDWAAYLIKQQEAFRQMNQMHTTLNNFSNYAKHLEDLRALPEIRDKLLDSATGRKQFDKDAVMLMIKIFGGVIIALVICIMFLLTGQHFGLIDLMGAHK